MIEFIKPEYGLIEVMAQDLRESDKIEVMASHGHTPVDALKYSFENSEYVTMAVSDDIPFAMFGVTVSNKLTGLGHPWLLASNEVYNHKDYFLARGPYVIADMITVCPRLVNYVHHANKTSIKWLESLGFIVDSPAPYGVNGDLFHKFHMGVI